MIVIKYIEALDLPASCVSCQSTLSLQDDRMPAAYDTERAGFLCERCGCLRDPDIHSALMVLYASLLYAQQRRHPDQEFPDASTVFRELEGASEQLRAFVFSADRPNLAFLVPTTDRNQ